MKVIKFTFFILFAVLSLKAYSQSAYTNNSYIKNNIKQLSGTLSRAGAEALSETQVLKLEKVFSMKEVKWNTITKSGKDKFDMSQDMANLDKEYAPMIEELLSKEQKLAFRKATNNTIVK